MSINSTHLTVATNLDKTGYTVSTVQDKTGYTASTVSDKTGYTVSTVQDKTGYTVSTVSDKTAYGTVRSVQLVRATGISIDGGNDTHDITLGTTLTTYLKAIFIPTFMMGFDSARLDFQIISTTTLRMTNSGLAQVASEIDGLVVAGYVIEFY